jgi:hypothetical protein
MVRGIPQFVHAVAAGKEDLGGGSSEAMEVVLVEAGEQLALGEDRGDVLDVHRRILAHDVEIR